jgi:Protein of unknown function (DUF2938)
VLPRAARSVLLGLGATATMDAGAEVVRRATGVQPLDYRLVARWIGHMRQGRFAHASIAAADQIPGEERLGLVAHYAIGVGFAALLLAWRPGWAERPTLGPAMAVGLGSTAAPWLIMQPAFGLGVAAAKTPDPTTARLRGLRTHATYGLGLYVTGRAPAAAAA